MKQKMTPFPCPACGNTIDTVSFQVKDYSVSGKLFNICTCQHCTFSVTQPQPLPSEIGRYYQTENYISHSNTKKGLVNRLYHLVRKRNIQAKLSLVNRTVGKKGHLLDVGCGTGYFLSACKQNGWEIDGVEVSDLARAAAEQRTGQSVYASLEALSGAGRLFDIITLWHVFEHLHDINLSLHQLLDLLQPDGTLILALPNAAAADAVHYGKYWAGYDVPRHLSHFTPASMDCFLRRHGLKLVKTLPMKWDAYYISMLSEKAMNGKTSFAKAFLNACISNSKARRDDNYSSLIYVIKK
jgi:SAM-dependent methyltransferase